MEVLPSEWAFPTGVWLQSLHPPQFYWRTIFLHREVWVPFARTSYGLQSYLPRNTVSCGWRLRHANWPHGNWADTRLLLSSQTQPTGGLLSVSDQLLIRHRSTANRPWHHFKDVWRSVSSACSSYVRENFSFQCSQNPFMHTRRIEMVLRVDNLRGQRQDCNRQAPVGNANSEGSASATRSPANTKKAQWQYQQHVRPFLWRLGAHLPTKTTSRCVPWHITVIQRRPCKGYIYC